MIVEDHQKFIFQPKLAWQFNEDFYDKWNDVTLSCVSGWYDINNAVHNKVILQKYIENKYIRYYKNIVFGPTLCFISPEPLIEFNLTTEEDVSINTTTAIN